MAHGMYNFVLVTCIYLCDNWQDLKQSYSAPHPRNSNILTYRQETEPEVSTESISWQNNINKKYY
jgi:hypothetical protein